ncbi:MAG: hypothetical protein AB1733_00845 [Thermodesulfobacteriota bacterium]
MKRVLRTFYKRIQAAAIMGAIFTLILVPNSLMGTQTGLPADLFVDVAPANAVAVGDARKAAQEGKPIVITGRVGGVAKPIADKYAMFLISDPRLPLCKDACADLCHIPRPQLIANLATVQVVDNAGRPLKVSVQGINGLKPLAEVIIRGTVAKVDRDVMIINAQNIFVNRFGN